MKYWKILFTICFITVLLILSLSSKPTKGLNNNEIHYEQIEKDDDRFNVYLFLKDGNKASEEIKNLFLRLDSELLNKFNLYTFDINEDVNSELKKKVSDVLNDEDVSEPYLVIGERTFDEYSASYDDKISEALEDESLNEDHYDVLDYVETDSVE